jgi:hypothetical protein
MHRAISASANPVYYKRENRVRSRQLGENSGMNWRSCLWAAILVLLTGSAFASGQGTGAMQKWKTMDVCAKQAQIAFPDFTAESNAKREAKLKNCLNANNLPPREPAAPSQ